MCLVTERSLYGHKEESKKKTDTMKTYKEIKY